jgi:acyl-CoA synthetase (AMP-forming)/AMP-acid ligase II
MPQTPANIYEAVFGDSDKQNDTTVAAVDLGSKGESVSYAQLKRVVDVARTTTNIEAGENVALVMPNSMELIVGLLAMWAQGAATVPLNPSYTAVEFKVRNGRALSSDGQQADHNCIGSFR